MRYFLSFWVNPRKKEEALQAMERASQIDPTSLIIKTNLAMLNYQLGDEQKGVAIANEVLAISPNFPVALHLKYIQMNNSDVDEGIRKYEELLAAGINKTGSNLSLCNLNIRKGDHAAAMEYFLEIIGDPRTTRDQCGNIASLYCKFGKFDFANLWLAKALDNNEPGLWDYAVLDEYAEWQNTPKFIELMKSVNHPLYVDK